MFEMPVGSGRLSRSPSLNHRRMCAGCSPLPMC